MTESEMEEFVPATRAQLKAAWEETKRVMERGFAEMNKNALASYKDKHASDAVRGHDHV